MLRALERHGVLRSFERTAGDEFQGVLDDPVVVVDIVLELVRSGGWSIGIGVGPVDEPLPASTREGRGPAFVLAREAVEAAKRHPGGVAVRGELRREAADAEAMLTLLAVIVARRSPAAWEAIDLVTSGATATEAALKLGVSRQAVGQRLAAGHWREECEARPTAARLIGRAA
jgi:hypothetical protein